MSDQDEATSSLSAYRDIIATALICMIVGAGVGGFFMYTDMSDDLKAVHSERNRYLMKASMLEEKNERLRLQVEDPNWTIEDLNWRIASLEDQLEEARKIRQSRLSQTMILWPSFSTERPGKIRRYQVSQCSL